MGSRALAQRLRESLATLENFGVRVPVSGRHRKAVSLLEHWNSSSELIDITDTDRINRLEAAHRTAWECYLITVAAEKHRKKHKSREDLFTLEALAEMLRGPEIPRVGDRDTSARDTQFELYIAAQLELAGVEVYGGEPDVRFRYGTEIVGIAAKRVSSLDRKQLQKHLNKAVEQIERSGMRGWVALNIDSRFRDVDIRRADAEFLDQFSSIFDDVHTALNPHWQNKDVLGVLAFGHVAAWLSPEQTEDPPRLNTAEPFRWHRWSEDSSDETLHTTFTRGYSERLRRRLQVLTSDEFEGVL